MAKLPCRIRKYRKSAQLSQRELTMLLGLASQGSFSEVEAGRKGPSATVLLACEIVFDTRARELFPGIYNLSKRTVRTGAGRLLKAVKKGGRPLSADVLALSKQLAARSRV